MKEKYCEYDLEVEYIGIITCSSCGMQSEIPFDDAENLFFKEGWRMTKNHNQYCPKCAKKKLK